MNKWDLYESMPGWTAAHMALEKAWAKAKVVAPDKPANERALLAARLMWPVMEKWRSFGADDSEPHHELRARIRAHFNVDYD